MSNNHTQTKIIRTKDAWTDTWLESLAEYWGDREKYTSNTDDNAYVSLYDLLKDLEVENIEASEDDYVTFLAYPRENGTKGVGGMEIVKVRGKRGNKKLPYYDLEEAYLPINGWKKLTESLTIKLPPESTKNLDASKQTKLMTQYMALKAHYPFGATYEHPYESFSEEVEYKKNTASLKATSLNEQAYSLGQVSDRGGASGLNDDYEWVNFIPRLIAYNWSTDVFSNGDSLRDYPELLNDLGYTVPDILSIKLEYADEGSVDENGQITDINAFTSKMDIVYPYVKKNDENAPIKLADFAALRANHPFTCI